MSDDDRNDVVCSDCETQPVLVETPFVDDTNYVLECDCERRGIDVSNCVSDNALVEPVTGKWSNFDVDSSAKPGE